jgi:GNAT superfamily N-acetyltransferase
MYPEGCSHPESAEGNTQPSSQTKSSGMSDDIKPSETNSSRNDNYDKAKDDPSENSNEDMDNYDEDDLDEDGDDYGGDNDSLDEEDYDEGDEDYEDPEYEVEEHELTLSGDPEQVVKLRLHVSKEEPFEMWLDNVHATCAYEGKYIAYGIGRYINRGPIRADFWRDMDEPSRDMSDIAFGIFDRYGCLQANLKEHCVRRGTGVWGSELDIGPLFLIERVEVTDREWRRKGLGRAMVNALIQKAQKKENPRTPSTLDEAIFWQMRDGTQDLEDCSRLNTVILPGWLHSDVETEREGRSRREQYNINNRAINSAIAFFRSVGFRRIGGSHCLGFSSDPNHKSHALSIIDDFDMPGASAEDELSDGDDEMR